MADNNKDLVSEQVINVCFATDYGLYDNPPFKHIEDMYHIQKPVSFLIINTKYFYSGNTRITPPSDPFQIKYIMPNYGKLLYEINEGKVPEATAKEYLATYSLDGPFGKVADVAYLCSPDIEKLQNYVLEIYKKPLSPLESNDAKEMAVIIGNRLSKLNVMAKVRRFDFDYQYHLLIEKIRKFYSRLCGCPDIPVTKAYKIYTDDDYREAFCHGKVPEEDFIALYFEAIGCQGDIEEKLEYATKLYEYTTRDLKINLNHYRIRIKSRNNPMNTNHE